MFVNAALSLGLLLISTAAISEFSILTVSPGGLQEPTQIADTCPTFSWGSATGATRYQIAVFDALDNDSSEYAEQMAVAAAGPILQASIEAPALSWTPASDQCLDQGGSYLWFILATTADSVIDWSQGRRFEIDLEGGVLAETVHQEVAMQLSQPETWRKMVKVAFQGKPGITLRLQSSAQTLPLSNHTATLTTIPIGKSGGDTLEPRATFDNPSAFRISSPGGVLFDDPSFVGKINEWGTGAIPAEGAGARFMWYPGKAALRAGYVKGGQWDDSNIGAYSTALGYNTTANRDQSTAMGDNATASGETSIAIGSNTLASGNYSTAMGHITAARGVGSTAMGVTTSANGDSSTAMGQDTTAKSAFEMAIGRYNTDYVPTAEDWNETDRLFVIGNGTGEFTRSDAVVVLKSGNTGIGTSTPEVPLQVDADVAIDDCNLNYGGYLVTGDRTATSICIDDNEIMARASGTTSTLYLNNDGGLTRVGGYFQVGNLAGASGNYLCVNTNNTLASCSSSERYKEFIEPLPLGLEIVEKLKPVSFKWKGRDEHDLGFIAEQVATVDPLLTTYGQDGEIRGVKYPQLTAVLVNAMQEQQQEIASLRQELQQYRRLAAEVVELKRQLIENPRLLTSYRD